MGVQFLAFAVGIVLIVLGLGSLRQDWKGMRQLTNLEDLLETEGRVLKAEVRSDTSGAEDEFYPDMLFEYFIDGKSVWGWRLSLEEKAQPREYWVKRLEKYRVDDRIPVYFDRENPAYSMLEKRNDGLFRPLLSLTVSGGFTLFGLLLALVPLSAWMARFRNRKPGESKPTAKK